MKRIIFLVFVSSYLFVSDVSAQYQSTVWSKQKANEWYSKKGWLRGSNFIPSTAINQLEMWQKESFDTATIDRELGYAEGIGFNTMRVFLHHLAWQIDPVGFKKRVDKYLQIADKHHISTMFVFFDDCWNETNKAGAQPTPKVGVHNSGWVKDPGKLIYDQPTLTATLEKYVKDVFSSFKHDKRILLWDLYNEPGNGNYGDKSLALLEKIFTWARQVNPDQPLSAGLWNNSLKKLNTFQFENSDVITYHNYEKEDVHKKVIDSLKAFGRPLICTEYMARTRGSRFGNIMPLLKENNVGAINWGFVMGKTNTIYAWDNPMPKGGEPALWFHDIFRPDGTAYKEDEIKVIDSLTGKKYAPQPVK